MENRWRPHGTIRATHERSPWTVVQALRALCQTIDEHPQPFTIDNTLRTSFTKRFAELIRPSGISTALGAHSWLCLAWWAGLLVSDDDQDLWLRTSRTRQLVTEPFYLFPTIVGIMRSSAHVHLDPQLPGGHDFRFYLALLRRFARSDIARHVAESISDRLIDVAEGSTSSSEWFEDAALAEDLDLEDEGDELVRLRYLGYGLSRSNHEQMIQDVAWALISNLLGLLTELGICARGRGAPSRCTRLTPIGVQAIRAWADSHHIGQLNVYFHGALRWQEPNKLIATNELDHELTRLLLGSVAQAAEPAGTFAIDTETITRTLHAGEPADAVRQRLRSLASEPPPAALEESLQQAIATSRPVRVEPDICALELSTLTSEEITALKQHGLRQVGDLLIGHALAIDAALEACIEGTCRSIDYSTRPDATATISNDLILTRSDGRHDLRLQQILVDLGAQPNAASVQVTPEQLGIDDDATEAANLRRMNAFLRRLEPHLTGNGVPPAARTRLLADAGVIDPPQVTESVVLTFDPVVAQGLVDNGVLGEVGELLTNGRLLVPKHHLAEVEERLSELGVPFPAEHSSLRDTAHLQAAVHRLGEALRQPATPTTGSASEPPPRKASESAKPTGPRARHSEPTEPTLQTVLEAIRRASANGGRGATLGELASATGIERKQLQPMLKRLVRDERATLTGHARGARYRTD
jgi:hypothetical protein